MDSYFGLDSKFVDSENIISKLNLLFRLERMDPYSTDSTLRERIQISLQYIKPEYRQFALALFANTVYFPEAFSKSVLQHLLNNLLFNYGIGWDNLGRQCLLLEQDPTGIVNDFLRTNNVHGRLDREVFPRTQQVSEFVKMAVRSVEDGNASQIESVSAFLKREYWVVLVDNSLSGTSLISDVKRLINLANIGEYKPKKIVLLIRTLAEKAYKSIQCEFSDELNNHFLEVYYGLYLDNRFVITENNQEWDKCVFFNNTETYAGVVEACKWLTSQSEYINDPLLESQKANSIEDKQMTFGFRKCGLTFVSSENCPSDSLPLLWYKLEGFYESPFPRVISRTGGRNDGDQSN